MKQCIKLKKLCIIRSLLDIYQKHRQVTLGKKVKFFTCTLGHIIKEA